MESTRNDTSVEIRSIPTNRNQYTLLIATFCLFVATIVFFLSVAIIVWLFEHKQPYKYAVVCFMVGSGTLYVLAFTSSLILMANLSQRSRSLTREEPNIGFTGYIENDESCDAASDISYRGGSQLLQLPQRGNAIATPPPPYQELSEISTSQNVTGQVQSPQDSNNAGNSLNRFYYDLNRDEVQERELVARHRPLQRENVASGFDIEMQSLTSHRITGFSNNSYPLTNALKQQMASNSPLLFKKQDITLRGISKEPFRKSMQQESTSSENSPRSAMKGKRKPPQFVKRKLNAKLSMSNPDLYSKRSRNPRSNLNPKGKAPRSNRNGDTRTRQSYLNSQGSPKVPRSIAGVHTSQSVLNLEGNQRDSQLDSNKEIRSSQSNFNLQGTPMILRSKPEVRTSLTNLNPQGTPTIPRSNAVRTSQSNLSIKGGLLQASRLDWNEDKKSSLPNSKPEGIPQFSRSNIVRTSQMNLIPQARLETSQSSLNVDVKRTSPNLNPQDRRLESLSNMNSERRQFDSKSNFLVPTDKSLASHSNLHLKTQQSNLNANFYGLRQLPQVDTNSNASINVSRSNMDGVELKLTSQPVEQFQKLSQPQQFAACSKDVPNLQKAQSFTSLSVPDPLTRTEMETASKTTFERRLPNVSSARQMSGRSIESVLDATKSSKQMTPQEWIVAWNHGSRKLPVKEAERIAGVRI